MGILNIIMQSTKFLFGTKNLKGKGLALLVGVPASMVVYPVLESMGYIPAGFSEKIQDFNLPSYFNYLIGLAFVIYAFRDSMKKWLHGFTKDGRRDSSIEEKEDLVKIRNLELELLKIKKEIILMEKEIEKVTEDK